MKNEALTFCEKHRIILLHKSLLPHVGKRFFKVEITQWENVGSNSTLKELY